MATYAALLARSLVDEGARVNVLAPRGPGLPARVEDGGITVLRAFDRGARAVPAATRAALESGAPVVHLQHEAFLYGGPSAVPGLLASLAWLRGRRPSVVTMHQVVDTSTIDQDFTRLHRVAVPAPLARGGLALLQGGIPRLASATVVLEEHFRRAVRGSVAIPHGVEVPSGTDREQARAALGVRPDQLLALCFGFVAPYKGLELVLDAADRLAAAPGSRDVAVVIAGGAHPRLAGRDGYAEGLQSRYGSVATFTGYVPDEQVHPLFSAADVVLILYPRPFSSSGALAVALAHRRPILFSQPVANILGASPELVGPDDATGLASRLEQLAHQPVLRERLAAATDRLASARSWTEVARRHLQIYEEVRRGEPASSEPAPDFAQSA